MARLRDAQRNLAKVDTRRGGLSVGAFAIREQTKAEVRIATALERNIKAQEDKKRAEMYTREDENSAPLAAGLASADKMRRWADGRATEGAIIAPRCGLPP